MSNDICLGVGGYYLAHGEAMREPVDGVRQYVPTPFLYVLLLREPELCKTMFMKRILLCFTAALLMCPVFSQNTLTIHQKDGQQFSFGFADKPVITYTDTDLVLKTTRTELQYPLAQLAKFTFTDVEDAVISIKDDKAVQLELDNYAVNITGAKPGIMVSVTGIDGKSLAVYKTDADGSVTFSISELPEGIYIIKTESLTCKILKK